MSAVVRTRRRWASGTAGAGRCGTARSTSRPGGSPGWSGRTGRARRHCCTWPSGSCRRPRARSRSSAAPARPSPRGGRVGFVAQDTPTYAGLTVADHLRLGAQLNPRWDAQLAEHRIERLGLDPTQRAGQLSGGQRAQLALTLGLAKRPELLRPRRAGRQPRPAGPARVPAGPDGGVAEHELSVLLSSHLVADLERVCDYLVVLVDSRSGWPATSRSCSPPTTG